MINILIATHKNLKQTQRLIDTLKHPEVKIYVHIDKKCKENFELKGVTLIKNRYDVKWGGSSQLDATISCLKEMDNEHSHTIFMSGQDYLIEPIDEIVNYLKKNSDKEFIEYTKISSDDWNVEKRYTEYHTNNRYVDALLRRVLPKRTFMGNDIIPYGGSSWWILTKPAIDYVISVWDNNKISKKIKYTVCMDEIIFQTILFNSPFKNNMVNNIYRYIDWSDHIKGLNNGNPNILRKNDYEAIINSGKFIARKFDDKVDSEIFDMLDNYREKRKK